MYERTVSVSDALGEMNDFTLRHPFDRSYLSVPESSEVKKAWAASARDACRSILYFINKFENRIFATSPNYINSLKLNYTDVKIETHQDTEAAQVELLQVYAIKQFPVCAAGGLLFRMFKNYRNPKYYRRFGVSMAARLLHRLKHDFNVEEFSLGNAVTREQILQSFHEYLLAISERMPAEIGFPFKPVPLPQQKFSVTL
jgi:hypothetical protein